MATAPADNFGPGYYRMLFSSVSEVVELQYRLLLDGVDETTSVFAGSPSAGGNISFPTHAMGSVTGDFNQLQISVRFNGDLSGAFDLVGTWTFTTQSPAGNTVDIENPRINFPSGKHGAAFVAAKGLDVAPGQLSYVVRVKSGATVRATQALAGTDGTGGTAYTVPTANDRLLRTDTTAVENTSASSYTIDAGDTQVNQDSGTFVILNEVTYAAVDNYAPGAILSITQQDYFWTQG